MPRTFVSIVIPNRNSRTLITRIVADLSAQTHAVDFEIVIPDNGSTDPEVLRFYEGSAQ